MIEKLQSAAQTPQTRTGTGRAVSGTPSSAFGAMLQQQMERRDFSRTQAAQTRQTVNFSKHALARVEERGIELTPDLMGRLADSVEKAQEKGAKNILAFDNSQAFIVNIPYGRVITAMSGEEMKENIFTNIDGAVLL